MILTKEVEMMITNRNYNFYLNKGYNLKLKEVCKILVEDLSQSSHYKVKVCCDICSTDKKMVYFKYLQNVSNQGYYSCSNKCSMDKNRKTLIERYNKTHQCKIKSVCDRIIQTKVERGLVSYDFKSYDDYRRVVNLITERNKKDLLSNWDGVDYYDAEYIKEYFTLHSNDSKYPTIDHKVSVMFAFNNGWSPEKTSAIDNLCITKRINNCRKSSKCENEWK